SAVTRWRTFSQHCHCTPFHAITQTRLIRIYNDLDKQGFRFTKSFRVVECAQLLWRRGYWVDPSALHHVESVVDDGGYQFGGLSTPTNNPVIFYAASINSVPTYPRDPEMRSVRGAGLSSDLPNTGRDE